MKSYLVVEKEHLNSALTQYLQSMSLIKKNEEVTGVIFHDTEIHVAVEKENHR